VVRIKNPLGKESVLTPSLLPNFLKTIELNRRRGAKDIKIFEVARTFKKEEDGIKERKVLAAALTGKDTFHTLSSVSKGLLDSLGIKHTLSRTSHPSFHPGKCALMKHGKELLGILGEVHPDVKRSYGVENVCMFEIDWNKLIYLSNFEKFYKTLPKFPAIRRDVSILVREEDEARRYEKIMRENGGELLEQIKLFDVYKGDQIPSGYRSLSYTLIYRRKDRTLKDEEVERVHKRVLAELERAGAKIR
jgi:phenylalanyl-tRNA synthetase beta chain